MAIICMNNIVIVFFLRTLYQTKFIIYKVNNKENWILDTVCGNMWSRKN